MRGNTPSLRSAGPAVETRHFPELVFAVCNRAALVRPGFQASCPPVPQPILRLGLEANCARATGLLARAAGRLGGPIMADLSRITLDPDICHGKPCVRHMRWPVEVVLDLVSSGMGLDEIVADHPELEREDILACLHYARLLVSGEPLQRVA